MVWLVSPFKDTQCYIIIEIELQPFIGYNLEFRIYIIFAQVIIYLVK